VTGAGSSAANKLSGIWFIGRSWKNDGIVERRAVLGAENAW
jgi:hypothetical protein